MNAMLPPGFVLDEDMERKPADPVALPPGFELDDQQPAAVAPPGFVLDAAAPVPAPAMGRDSAAFRAAAAPLVEGAQREANIAAGVGERTFDLLGGTARAIGGGIEWAGDALESIVPLGRINLETGKWEPHTPESIAAPSEIGQTFTETAKGLEDTSLGYKPGTTWEDFKASPLRSFIPFALEQGLVSIPDMVAAIRNIPGYIVGRSGEIGQKRAENDNRQDATVMDMLTALPVAVGSAIMERFGTKGILGWGEEALSGVKQLPAAAGKAAVKEGGTEAVEEGAEYTATTAGTEKGFDAGDLAENMGAGAVGGAGFGAAARTVTGGVELATVPEGFQLDPVPAAPAPAKETTPNAAPPSEPATAPVEPVAPAGTVEPVVGQPAQPAAEPAAGPAPVEQGPSATFAPPVAPPSAVDPVPQLRTERVTTPDGEFETEVEFQVVEADQLKAAQGELQPRDRASRVGSDLQIQSMANKLDPLRLMGSRESDRGAPIVDEEGTILSGNGRTAAIIAAMNGNSDRYKAYRTSIEQMGFKTEGMKAPVLVRRAKGISPEDKRRFATRSNSDGGLSLSPTERAGIEQEYVTPDMLSRFDTDSEGGVTAAANAEFVRQFLRRVPQNENAAFTNKDGQLTPQGAQRIAGAIFARAYGDKSLVERFVEDEKDPALRNALTGAAAAWAAMRDRVKGTALDITPDLVNAIGLINRAKNAGMTMANFTSQADAFNQTPKQVQDIAWLFFNASGTRLAAWRDIRDRLRSYADQAARTGNASGDIFGGEYAATPESILSGIAAGIERNATKEGPVAATTPEPQNGGELFSGKETISKGPKRAAGGRVEQKRAAGPLLDAAEGVESDEDLWGTEDTPETQRAPRGTLSPKTEQVSFTNRASMYEEAYRVAGLTPDEGTLLPPIQKRNVLARVLEQVFGFKVDLDVKGAKISALDAADQMLDAYRNIRFMMHALELPVKAISLDGTLTIALERFKGRYFGAYKPGTQTIHMPGRSNSFAHEWAHALDHFLLDRMKPTARNGLFTREARNEGVDPTQDIDAAFVNLINTMFFDEADLAARVLQLEQQANETIKNGPKAGQPTQAAITAQEQIERLAAGSTRLRIKPSKYRKDSADYSPPAAGYFASVHEMLARAFEAYVAHKVDVLGGGSEFITKGEANYLGEADRRLKMTFPKDAERLRIFSALDDLFHHIRTQQVLGTDPAATRPQDVDIVDPQHWNRVVLNQGEPGILKAIRDEALTIRNAVINKSSVPLKTRLRSSAASFLNNAGVSTSKEVTAAVREAAQGIGDMTRFMFGSARGMMKAINRRNKGKGGEFLEFITDKFQTDIGTGKERGVTYEEARERLTLQSAGKIDTLLKGNGFTYSLSKADNDTIRELMFGKKVPGATSDLKAVAAGLRRLYNDAYRHAINAGLSMGYVEEKGYLPRVIQSVRVHEKPDAFVQDATKVYLVVYDQLTAGIEPDEMLALATRVNSRVAPKSDPLSGPYGAEIRALRSALKAAAKAAEAADKNKTDAKAAQAAADAQKAADDALANLVAAVRDDYARTAAEDWKGRILIGDSTTYDSHGPDSNFTKERKLPSEADDLLKDWYDNDVLSLTLGYVHHVSARAAYVERVGNSGGTKKLEPVIRRQDVRDAIMMDPAKYDTDTPKGRLAILRDLANPKTDNILEIALWEAQDHGADGRDVQTIRGIVEDFTGTKTRSPLSGMADRVSGFVYWLTYVLLLPKAAMTAITEPLTVMMRTGSVKASAITFGLYMTEAVRSAKSVQERAALARAIGLVSTPLFDTVLMNRLSGDFGHTVSGNVVLSRFFRANGLTQLTNAQRRAVMAGGFYWLRDMARVIHDPKASAVNKDIARAEFRELGIPDRDMDSLTDWLAQSDEHPSLTELETGPGKLYAAAVARYVDQTIQNPRRADKPLAAASPMGRMIYALTSFLYTFFRNVHLAALNRTGRDYNIAREHGAGKVTAALQAAQSPFATLVGGFGLMWVGQLIVTMAREAIFNQEQWEDKDEDERRTWLATLALSRTGIFGPGDLVLNALTGLRYERDLSSLGVGAGVAYFLSNVQNIIKGLPRTELWEGGPGVGSRNSDKTNTAERTAAKSLYRLTVAPGAAIALSALNASGPLGWMARYAALTYATSNPAAAGFADATVGPEKKKEDDE